MKSVMKHDFSRSPTISAPRSRFDRSFAHKTTFDAGWLVPFMWDPVLPGDTFNVRSTIFARMSTPLFPVMDNMQLTTHFFFVPYRLLWDNFRKFCGEQENPTSSIDFSIPILSGTIASDADGDLTTSTGRCSVLMNYLGVPQDITCNDVDISAMPFRAYEMIYDHWFRDQNIINSADIQTDDGTDDQNAVGERYVLQRRGKRHDYFTSGLPWPQKGDAVTVPIGTSAPVKVADGTEIIKWKHSTGDILLQTDGSSLNANWSAVKSAETPKLEDADLIADLSTATLATINSLREAFQVQKLLERDARGGTRYAEIVKNHFGVDFYDSSYRPEYLGGGSTPVNVNPVASTAYDNISGTHSGVGDLGAFATGVANGHGFSKSFVEHGLIMGIVSVSADLTYQQGLNRHFSHSTRYDIYWPSLAHLGEQAILSKEIFCDGTAGDEDVFAYQERHAEYRYKPSQISGKFLSSVTSPLDAWHLSQVFSPRPTLSQSFIEENPPIDRVIAVATEPHFIMDSYTKMICARPMPIRGVPGMIDHF